jgi:hypothetical protein
MEHIEIAEYSTRSQLRALADEANFREHERKRFLGLLQTAREAADKTARTGKYEMRLMYVTEDIPIMVTLLNRGLIGCSVAVEQEETPTKIIVSWA